MFVVYKQDYLWRWLANGIFRHFVLGPFGQLLFAWMLYVSGFSWFIWEVIVTTVVGCIVKWRFILVHFLGILLHRNSVPRLLIAYSILR
jgi:hypothetical protein